MIVSLPAAANQRLDVGDRAGVGEVAERQVVVAGTEVDAGRCAMAAPRGQRVRRRAADHRLDVGDRRHVGEVAERELVGAGVEIDRGVRQDASRA